MKTKKRMLSLAKETVRALSAHQLGRAAGGMNGTYNCTALCGDTDSGWTSGVASHNCTEAGTCATGIGC